MLFTGERYLGNMSQAQISYEHWHRYYFAREFVKNKSVLDIASGEGYGSFLLSKQANTVVGIDISEEAVLHARQTYTSANLEFLTGSASMIPINGSGIFDVVVSFETIEHISEEDQINFLREVKRVLKPGGLFIVSTPDKLLYSDQRNYVNEYHVKEFYREEFIQFLKNYFTQVKLCGQYNIAGSMIDCFDTEFKRESSIVLINYNDNQFIPIEKNPDPMFHIAICSDGDVESTNSCLIDSSARILSERDEDYIKIINEIHESYSQQISSVHAYYSGKVATLYLFKGETAVDSYVADIERDDFEISFIVNNTISIDSLRFDPAENRICRIKVVAIEIKQSDNQWMAFPLDKISTNGKKKSDGYYYFTTLDPMIFIPWNQKLQEIRIKGVRELEPLHVMEDWLKLKGIIGNKQIYLTQFLKRIFKFYKKIK
ncbi:MAG: class I SAM-dependent methyltransferase [Bacteroidales bacterium]